MRPVRPVLTALREDLALPSEVLGPLESWALAWFAICLAGETRAGDSDSGTAAEAEVGSCSGFMRG